MARRQVLGKGIHALIAEHPQDERNSEQRIIDLPVDVIAPNPHQPRTEFDDERLQELAGSIREKGLLQPIVVNRTTPDSYHLIAGERRLRASKLAGLEMIPAIVHEIESAQELMELALVENLQREDLSPIEEAEAYRSLMSTCMLSQDDIATRVGKDRSTVANTLRLLKLPVSIRQLLGDGALQMGHARALIGLDEDAALELATRTIEEGWTVRLLEKSVRAHGKGRKRKNVSAKDSRSTRSDPILQSYEDKLRLRYATAVGIHRGGKKGRIELEFYGDDDLSRILEILLDA
jgi:ParB family chromosome partitioning protein